MSKEEYKFEDLVLMPTEELQSILTKLEQRYHLYQAAKYKLVTKALWYQDNINKLRSDAMDQLVEDIVIENKKHGIDLSGYVIPDKEDE